MEFYGGASGPLRAKFSDNNSGRPRGGGGDRGGFGGGRGSWGEGGFRSGRGREFGGGRGKEYGGGRGSGGEGGFRGGRGREFGWDGGFRGGRGQGFRGSREFRIGGGFRRSDGDRGRGFRGSWRGGGFRGNGNGGRGESRDGIYGRAGCSRSISGSYKKGSVSLFVNDMSKEYHGYPGWSADEIHWILKSKENRLQNTNWHQVSSQLKRHSAKECEAVWMQITENLKPVTFKTSLDYVKELLVRTVDFNERDKYEQIPKGFKTLEQVYAEKENLTKEQVGDFFQRLQNMNPSKVAEYTLERRKNSSEHSLKCFDFYKDHPNVYEDIVNLSHLRRL